MPWLKISNFALLAFTSLTAIASIAVYLLSQAAERDKDRALERYKLDADRKIAQAHEGAELARADAERAKLETAKVSERLALTQERLDAANKEMPLSSQQLNRIVVGFKGLALGDTQPLWGAANDQQAQRRLLQLSTAFLEADLRLYTQSTTGSMVAPAGEEGDILVHYWSDDRRDIAMKIARIFRGAGLTANTYKLPPEPDKNSREATRNLVLVGIAARANPTYREP